MHGLIAWFARNSVAANLLMIFVIVWGLSALTTRIPVEVFPSFELDSVNVSIPFRGATPSEVEVGVTVKVEEAIQSVEGIKSMTSTANEGIGTVFVQVASGYDPEKILDDIKQRVDGISTFSSEVGIPRITIPSANREVISVVVAGAMPEKELRLIAARVRDDIEALPNVSTVSVSGARSYEIGIEISQRSLEGYGLTLAAVSQAIEASSLDLAAGAITTGSGEVLLRTRGQAYEAADFGRIVVRSGSDGTRVTISDIATIKDGFEEAQIEQQFNGQNSIEIDVYRTGLQSAITVADAVKEYLVTAQASMPYGVTLGYWRDWSRTVRARLDTLTNSAMQGGILVVLLLSFFLRFWVAVWVFVGVPVSILGGIALMPIFGVSLNLLSLFAFILVLGIVVDDAIVTGENIFSHMRRKKDPVQAAIEGTQEVAMPVTFGVLTTMAAFAPLLMIEGARGQLFAQIPLIVIPVLLFSIIESKFVLPSHMSHLNFHSEKTPNVFARMQYKISDGFEHLIHTVYQPMLATALRNRYLVLSLFVGGAIIIFSLVSSGHVRFVFFPRVQSETARAVLEMPAGTPFEVTQKHIQKMSDAVLKLQAKHIDPVTNESVIESVLSTAGSSGGGSKASHRGRVMFEITPPEERTLVISSLELVAEWRREIGSIPGAVNVSYRAEIGRGGSPIDVEISGFEFDQMAEVAGLLKQELSKYPGVSEISDTFEGGKEEIQLSIKPAGRQLGITLADIASQVRTAYLGTEVQSIQRNRDEVKVIVRYPKEERASLAQLERLSIRMPTGESVPLASVANLDIGRGYSQIRRVDRRRTVNVQAEVNKATANIEGIKIALSVLAESLEIEYPDVRISLEGEAREQRESFASLRVGLLLVLLVIYTLLAIPFGSYVQPLLVMIVIPFGVVGGILGHMIMGMSLSLMSYMGMLALCGVVVNDSLVLVDWVNRQRRQGVALLDAVRTSGVARFRAVILTSLTTFFGLLPLIFETSTQAQFLIPMAVSLGFGILFATAVTLILIPVNYLVLEDLRKLFGRGKKKLFDRAATNTL
ncbi:MAG: multidrug efflux pump subunit AcrB [bacterium]|jgi:multidrug efflux pump subunit AcrB